MSEQKTISVLIVTDTHEGQQTVDQTLAAEADLKVIGTVASSDEALAIVKQHKPDIALMDYDMPGLDGAETTRAIIRESERTQIIMLSVVNDVNDIRHAMRAGARDYLIKPLSDDELVETIRWLIRERREYARMQSFVKQLRKAYEAIFTDDKQVPDNVILFLEKQVIEKPDDMLTIETLAVSYARNRSWEKLLPLVEHLLAVKG